MNKSEKSTRIAIMAPAKAHLRTGNEPTVRAIAMINSSMVINIEKWMIFNG